MLSPSALPERLAETAARDLTAAALACAECLVYEWHVASDRITWGDNADMFFARFGVATPVSRSDLKLVADAEDVALIDRAVDEAAREEHPFRVDFRVVGPDGAIFWIEDRGATILDINKRPDRVIGVLSIVTDRKLREQRLAYLASYDELTGLFNRAFLLDELGAKSLQPGAAQRCYFLLFGIDDLGAINSGYGFGVADQVIVSIGQRLKAALPGNAVVGRMAGNKFGAIVRADAAIDLNRFCGEILLSVSRTVVRTEAGPVSATLSIGAVAMPDHAETGQEALAAAEDALTRAKQQGRDCQVIFERAADEQTVRRRNVLIADQIVSALNERRVTLAYQPIVSAADERPAFWESLLRIIQRDGNLATAGDFIPVAERLGMIRLLDRRALELAVRELHNYGRLVLTLNVSAMTATDPIWARKMVSYLKDNAQVCSRLIVEITETYAITDLSESIRFVSELRALGCQVAIDDFGAGYTSFRNLRMLDVSLVKLDGSFIRNLHQSPDNQHFVRALIELARNLDIRTVAEWVDDQRDVDLLRSWGVDYLQGFYYGRPTLTPDWLVRKIA